MKFEYEIKGITLNECEMRDIKQYYEILCTAEYILENYELTEEEAIKYAYEIRSYMDKNEVPESEVIKEIMKGR